MDINKLFGSQLPQWVKAVNDGANIEEFKQRIRDVAKIGLPERIGKLIDNGIDSRCNLLTISRCYGKRS
jgi:hypothetical protein